MNRATEKSLDRIVDALASAFNGHTKAALIDLLNWKPEDAPRPIKGYGITATEMKKVPFFCETYLYGLLGKEDARTLLAYTRRVCEAAGFDIDTLQNAKDEE